MNIDEQRTPELTAWAQMVEKLRVAMLVTQTDGGELRSRPLTPLEIDATPTVWFLVSRTAELASEIRDNRQVCLTFAQPSGDYASATGIARLQDDRARLESLWNPVAEIYFPGGIDDPDLTALGVTVRQAEYWDTPDGKLRRVLAFARAMGSGDADRLGSHHSVRI